MKKTKFLKFLTLSMMTLALLMFVRVFAFDNQGTDTSVCLPTCLVSNGNASDVTWEPGRDCWEWSWYPNIDGCDCPGYCWTYLGKEHNCTYPSPGNTCTSSICTTWIWTDVMKCSIYTCGVIPEPN